MARSIFYIEIIGNEYTSVSRYSSPRIADVTISTIVTKYDFSRAFEIAAFGIKDSSANSVRLMTVTVN